MFYGRDRKITYIYNALGQKVQKYVVSSSITSSITNYMNGGFQYTNNVLKFFPHAEGYINVTSGKKAYSYVYQYKDHLGNNRLSYTNDILNPGSIKILEENHYYPFGLKHTSYNTTKYEFVEVEDGANYYINITQLPAGYSSAYKYKYNGKELQDELGLNVTAMDFRQYDNAIGRFNGIDVLSEVFMDSSPYAFVMNSPIFFSDPTGLCPECEKNVQNPKNGQSYISDAGETYIFGEGGWTREGGELRDIVITPNNSSESSGEESSITLEDTAEFVTDFVPGGSVKDIYRGARDGDYLQLSMGVGFLILDVATLGSGSIVRGTLKQGLKQGAKQLVKIQKHHIIPKKVFKSTPELVNFMKRDVGQNLKKLPAGFHGNHPAYSSYVQRRITEMIENGTLNENNIKLLQNELTKRINQAYDNYKVTGENLNDYFKVLNGN